MSDLQIEASVRYLSLSKSKVASTPSSKLSRLSSKCLSDRNKPSSLSSRCLSDRNKPSRLSSKSLSDRNKLSSLSSNCLSDRPNPSKPSNKHPCHSSKCLSDRPTTLSLNAVLGIALIKRPILLNQILELIEIHRLSKVLIKPGGAGFDFIFWLAVAAIGNQINSVQCRI